MNNQNVVLYILTVGEYDRQSIEMNTPDINPIAKKYAELTNKKDYISSYDRPSIQVWKNNEVIGYFSDFEKVEMKIKKACTKIAMGLC